MANSSNAPAAHRQVVSMTTSSGSPKVACRSSLIWSYAMIFSKMIDPPLAVYAIPPLALFFFKLLKLYYVYRSRVGTNQKETLQAALAGLALSYVISKAMLYGVFTDKIPFLRTPKNKDRESVWFALLLVSEEAIITLLLWGAAQPFVGAERQPPCG